MTWAFVYVSTNWLICTVCYSFLLLLLIWPFLSLSFLCLAPRARGQATPLPSCFLFFASSLPAIYVDIDVDDEWVMLARVNVNAWCAPPLPLSLLIYTLVTHSPPPLFICIFSHGPIQFLARPWSTAIDIYNWCPCSVYIYSHTFSASLLKHSIHQPISQFILTSSQHTIIAHGRANPIRFRSRFPNHQVMIQMRSFSSFFVNSLSVLSACV